MSEGISLETLLKDVNRIKKCSKITKQELCDSLDNVIDLLTEAKNQIREPMDIEMENQHNQKVRATLNTLHDKLKIAKPLKRIMESHKSFFLYLSKYGKNIEKFFKTDINLVFKDKKSSFSTSLINEAIAEYLLADKQFDLYENFMNEMGLAHKINLNKLASLKTFQHILTELLKNNLQDAIEWANVNKQELEKRDSILLFLLHRLKFLQLISVRKIDGILYARQHFRQFFLGNKKESDLAQHSMAFLLCDQKQIDSLCEGESVKKEIEQLFLRNYCDIESIIYILKNLSIKSALLQCLIAGTLALPKFMKFAQIEGMEEEHIGDHERQEYPIEVDIGNDFKYHSVFVCPISRDVVEPEHPPVLLTCGHVISEFSMRKITASSNKDKFKCPTCPREMSTKETQKIYF